MSKKTLLIIDYGSGNLRSAAKAFETVVRRQAIDYDVLISQNPEDILKADRLVLPGQGAFKDCMEGLGAIPGMIEALNESVLDKGRPFLGICVGMQLLATRGLEGGITAGLNWIKGEVVPMAPTDASLKIPQMGWNTLIPPGPPDQDNRHFVLRSLNDTTDVYFVHSYCFECSNLQQVLAYTDYGGPVPAVIGRDNIIGMQFHPEKSAAAGLNLLSDFLLWRP